MRRTAATALILICCVFASTVLAQATSPQVTLKRGDNYREIPRQPVTDDSRIEVVDFFFYACPYCNELRPALEKWRKAQGDDIVFRRVPAVRRDTWMPLARTYYTLEALGEVDRLHEEVYKGYHDEQLHMSKPEVMADWAVRNGIARERWVEVYSSEETTRKVEQARAMTAAYDIQGTPSLVVDGRYLTSGGLTDNIALMVPVMEALIELARSRR